MSNVYSDTDMVSIFPIDKHYHSDIQVIPSRVWPKIKPGVILRIHRQTTKDFRDVRIVQEMIDSSRIAKSKFGGNAYYIGITEHGRRVLPNIPLEQGVLVNPVIPQGSDLVLSNKQTQNSFGTLNKPYDQNELKFVLNTVKGASETHAIKLHYRYASILCIEYMKSNNIMEVTADLYKNLAEYLNNLHTRTMQNKFWTYKKVSTMLTRHTSLRIKRRTKRKFNGRSEISKDHNIDSNTKTSVVPIREEIKNTTEVKTNFIKLSEFSTEDLVKELMTRNYKVILEGL